MERLKRAPRRLGENMSAGNWEDEFHEHDAGNAVRILAWPVETEGGAPVMQDKDEGPRGEGPSRGRRQGSGRGQRSGIDVSGFAGVSHCR